MPDLKKVIRQEYLKCARDPIHFMRKYCYIQHPQRGRIQFNLYPFQEKVLTLFQQNDYSAILKSRQLGISTLTAGYSLWLMTFHKDRNVLALATTQATARNLVTKVQFMWENLPSWLKVDSVENNKLSLRFTNGSKIQAKSSNADAARSEAVSLLIIDEAAFIDNIAETWASAQQTLATGGGAIVLSTPYGTGNWFHQTWVKAENSENDFLPIKLPWYVHPERDQTWRDAQDNLLGDPRLAAQECDCDFSTSGDIVFYNEYLEYYEKSFIKDPLERRGADQNLWVWENADYSRSYMVLADVARGDGKDFSTCHVMDIETNVQVAEYKGQIGTKEYGLPGVAGFERFDPNNPNPGGGMLGQFLGGLNPTQAAQKAAELKQSIIDEFTTPNVPGPVATSSLDFMPRGASPDTPEPMWPRASVRMSCAHKFSRGGRRWPFRA